MDSSGDFEDLDLNRYYDLVLTREILGDGQGNDDIGLAEIFKMASDEDDNTNDDDIIEEGSDTQIPLVKQTKCVWLGIPCMRRNCSKNQKSSTISTTTVTGYTNPCNFFRCPTEVRAKIFRFLTQSELINSRAVCLLWKTEIDSEVLSVTTTLSLPKVKDYAKLARKKRFKINVNHYDLQDFETTLKRKLLERLPEPRSVNIMGSICPKFFTKMVSTWRNLRSICFGIEALAVDYIFWYWKSSSPLEYFPKLETLEVIVDRINLESNEFVPRTFRYNVDSLLTSPYENVRILKYHLVNLGHHYPCAFLAPILMFVGRNCKNLKEIDIIFHTGIEADPPLGTQLHAPINFSPVQDELYVHGEKNLSKLQDCQLDRIKLHIPSIEGCRTKSGICNYFKTIIQSQDHLKELIVETEAGISLEFLGTLLNRKDNARNLTILDVTLQEEDFLQRHRRRTRGLIKPLDLATFSICLSLKSLRLKRIGMLENTLTPHIRGTENLPVTLEKLFFSKLNISWSDLHEIIKCLPNLQCLFLDRCDIQGNNRKTEELISRTLIDICFHDSLKFFSLSPTRRSSLRQICLRLLQGEETSYALTKLGWKWFLIVKESSNSRRLIFHKGKEFCKNVWFETYVFERHIF